MFSAANGFASMRPSQQHGGTAVTPPHPLPRYSLSASTGFSFAARRAGKTEAIIATADE